MAKQAQMLIFSVLLLAAPQAKAWVFPIAADPGDPEAINYTISSNGFWSCDYRCYHLGQDIVAAADTEIVSVCSGIVVEITYRNNSGNYGGRVLIECNMPDGQEIVVLYGHLGLDSTDPAKDDIYVSVGDTVAEGEVIGRLGTRSENGGFTPHLHIGTHRGAYLGSTTECDRWTYAGYTAATYQPSADCYCDVMDNWIDPLELLGIIPQDLRIVSGEVSPQSGYKNDTLFTWHLSAEGGHGAYISATVFIYNPVQRTTYPFVMRYITGTSFPPEFEHSGRTMDQGTYFYRFRVETCADETEESEWRPGPVVTLPEIPCVPEPETCDNADNDCDGDVDEEVVIPCTGMCGNGTQTCDHGLFSMCTASIISEEVCDGIDNNCDGRVDDGLEERRVNECGSWEEDCIDGVMQEVNTCHREPSEETCNNYDDDCDGMKDEGLTRECVTVCGTAGDQICVSGSWGNLCWPRYISEEVCDGEDNDCDGQTDEGITVWTTNACGDVGHTCSDGQWIISSGREPAAETCNNTDDDCDGLTDEEIFQDCGNACGTGRKPCVNGTWGDCPVRNPSAEICDNIDNDCNGQTDEPGSQTCTNECGLVGIRYCSGGTWGRCLTTMQCPPPCAPQEEICDNADNDCDEAIDEGLSRSCSNECGNAGIQNCSAGNWSNCDAPACPPPEPEPEPCIPSEEVCDNADNDCDGQTDEDLLRFFYNDCSSWTEDCVDGIMQQDGEIQEPTEETCNNYDDDCDGQTDEGLIQDCSNACGAGNRRCVNGGWGNCSARIPSVEICDGVDNNCNGQIDEPGSQACTNECGLAGVRYCSDGRLGRCMTTTLCPPPCTPQEEICDNADNDCDGRVDENLLMPCANECGHTGNRTCRAGMWSICNATVCPEPEPEPEVCDNTDNDLDGQVDEGLSQSCENACGSGTQTCSSGAWSQCSARQPGTEICDNADNDCDSRIDEELSRSCENACGSGTLTCSNGVWSQCSARQPSTEVCDNADNDCDSRIDEELSRSCENECGTGTQTCSNGVWSQCSARQPGTEICDGVDNDCDSQIDEDITVTCYNGCRNAGTQTCSAGTWNSCNAPVCLQSEVTDPPPLISPGDNRIKAFDFGTSARVTLDWDSVANASSYEYVIRFGGIYESGSLIEQSQTSQTEVTFSRDCSYYGVAITWKVRGLNIVGSPGPWSQIRTFYMSYPTGSVVKCVSNDCPFRDAWYQISGDIETNGDLGIPNLLIADWIGGSCAAGRTARQISFSEMSGYKRSARYNGCPPH